MKRYILFALLLWGSASLAYARSSRTSKRRPVRATPRFTPTSADEAPEWKYGVLLNNGWGYIQVESEDLNATKTYSHKMTNTLQLGGFGEYYLHRLVGGEFGLSYQKAGGSYP